MIIEVWQYYDVREFIDLNKEMLDRDEVGMKKPFDHFELRAMLRKQDREAVNNMIASYEKKQMMKQGNNLLTVAPIDNFGRLGFK